MHIRFKLLYIFESYFHAYSSHTSTHLRVIPQRIFRVIVPLRIFESYLNAYSSPTSTHIRVLLLRMLESYLYAFLSHTSTHIRVLPLRIFESYLHELVHPRVEYRPRFFLGPVDVVHPPGVVPVIVEVLAAHQLHHALKGLTSAQEIQGEGLALEP